MCFQTVLSFVTHICDSEISSAFSIVLKKETEPDNNCPKKEIPVI